MELHRQLNLLDQALGLDEQSESWPLRGKVVLIEDCVETSGAFVLHHLVKRALSQKLSPLNGIVIFISFSQSFSHYARILQKLGCNLAAQRDNKRLIFFDMLMFQYPEEKDGRAGEGGFISLYRKLQEAVGSLYTDKSKNITIVVDDISSMEAQANFENPLIKQYSAEYWILGDLMTPPNLRTRSFAKRVFKSEEADVIFVPFFATLSAEMQLGRDKAKFRKKEGNVDYQRQREVVDLVRNSEAWKRSGGRDHVFVLTEPVAMWHVRAEIAPAVLLVVDFGGWFKVDSKYPNSSSSYSDMIQHTQVSLLKDVIVPYTHFLPTLTLRENKRRRTLVYFKGAKHRHRGGVIQEKLWDLLVGEPGVIFEEGFPNATGREQSIKGMRTSEFCLHPAGDTPTSCRLFDAIQSLCIPVVVSDEIDLPFEGILDYSEFSVFVSFADAVRPKWLLSHLRSFSDGSVNHIWRKVHQKLPLIKEAIVRDKRKPPGVSIPLRCHCT